eukprot:CAMPEP_0194378866 /NCGR_PEP_ID=MMETSP0174-20130528/37149_1 /TAXON_ID=216777 /ORGANISM="Proboscia alata, Strain PI-D3" /LENGTH=303 /DNA_ID=CAMNT_0039161177 /DNA_START=56 /DNA_END=964 /DNA_ORIENTATION=+
MTIPLIYQLNLVLYIYIFSHMDSAFSQKQATHQNRLAKDESSDRLSSWKKRWGEDKIGWHENEIHNSLKQFGHILVPNFSLEAGESMRVDSSCNSSGIDRETSVRVFVPLCGKSVDLAFLAKQKGVLEVVGVDGIRKALEEFQSNNPTLEIGEDLERVESHAKKFDRFRGKKITLLKGDYFDLDIDSIGGELFDSIWDRASLVAIQPNLRKEYIEVLSGIIKPGGTILLSTLNRKEGDEKARKAGPPFSVDEAEVRRLYEGLDWVESVENLNETDELSERFKSQGLTSVVGLTFVIQVKKTSS